VRRTPPAAARRAAPASTGELRRSQNWIGGTRPGNAVYVPPPARQVAPLLADVEGRAGCRPNHHRSCRERSSCTAPEPEAIAGDGSFEGCARSPKCERKKLLESVCYRLEVVAYFKSTGEGWQSRVDGVLQQYVARHSRRR